MDRRHFLRSILMVGGAVVGGAALLPRDAQAASLLDTLKDMDAPARAPEGDLPAADAQEVQRRRFFRRRRSCVTRIGPRGRVRRICRIG